MEKTKKEKAVEIANSGFTTELRKEKTTDGESLYLAVTPELEGCMAQGESAEEALESLKEIRLEYIEHLLEFNLPIPSPQSRKTEAKAWTKVTQRTIDGFVFSGHQNQAVQSDEEIIFSTSLNVGLLTKPI
jgi:predicted RNase H-like HicB family nuclease